MTMISEARVPPIGKIAQQRDALIAGATDRQAMVWNSTLGVWQNSSLTQSDISGLTSSLAAKANLAGGNSYTGTQDFGAADLVNGRIDMTTLSGNEHHLYNSWLENNVLGLANLHSHGYSAIAIRNYLQQEKTAWGYGNELSVAPAGYAFLEMSDATVGGVGPPFLVMQTTTYAPVGDPDHTTYGQYHKILLDGLGNLYIYPKQVSFADPLVYSSFRHTTNGQQTRFGPDSGHYFDFNHDGFTAKFKFAGGTAFDMIDGIILGGSILRVYNGKMAVGPGLDSLGYLPSKMQEVVGDVLATGTTGQVGGPEVQTLGGYNYNYNDNDVGFEVFTRYQAGSYNVNGGGVVNYPGARAGMRKRNGTWHLAAGGTQIAADFVIQTSVGGSTSSLPTLADRLSVGYDGLFIPNAVSAPATRAGGGTLYVTGGALRYKGSSGTDVQIAAA